MEKIVLIGSGGHCKAVADAIKKSGQYQIHGILTDQKNFKGLNGISILGDDSEAVKIFNSGITKAFLAIGSLVPSNIRIRVYKEYSSIGFKFPSIRHPEAVIAEDVKIGKGTFIAANATICPGTRIADNVIVNSGAIIDHDCNIENFVHVATGVAISGGVYIGKNTHLGTGACIIQGITIGSNTLIGAGSIVVKNIPDRVKAYGNPCRVVEQLS